MNDSTEGSTANIIYILYLVAIILGVTAIVGLIMAYVNKGEAPEWVASHYRLQIRTFWISLLYGVIGAATVPVFGVGFVVLLLVLVWWIVRCVKGMKSLSAGEAYPNPASWLW